MDELVRLVENLRARVERLETLEVPVSIDNYTDVVYEGVSNTSLSAGSNNIDSTAVPAGEVHVITNISVSYTGTVSGVSLRATLFESGVGGYVVFQEDSISSTYWYDRQGNWVLPAGDYVRLVVSGATLNDDAYLRITGYKFSV